MHLTCTVHEYYTQTILILRVCKCCKPFDRYLFSTFSGVTSFLVSGQLRQSWSLVECYKFILQRATKMWSCVLWLVVYYNY